MSIYINRPMLNSNLKGFSRFLKKFESYPNTKVMLTPLVSDVHSQIPNYDTLIFLNHGSKSKMYHKYDINNKRRSQILIDSTNIDLLSDKKVFAISCKTANVLGPLAIKNNCKVYLGISDFIEFEPKNLKINTHIKGESRDIERSDYYMKFLEGKYKKIFFDGLNKAIKRKEDFKWLHMYCEKKFSEASKLEGIDRELKFRASLTTIKSTLRNLSQSFVLLGDEKQKVE